MKVIYKAPCGELVIEVKNGLVCRCQWRSNFLDNGCVELTTLPQKSVIGYEVKGMGPENNCNGKDAAIMKNVVIQLDEYFAGKRQGFELPLQIEGTPFRKKVWQALMKIPYGEVVSYSELAVRCNCPRGQRAVAQACSANLLSIIIPCHRVVKSDGSLGGYTIAHTVTVTNKGTTPRGLAVKRFLLDHESKER